MDIYDYLKMDHDKVDHLFKLFEKSTLLKRQHEIVTLIIQELLVHAHSEQETFYKMLAQFPETRDISRHGAKEHREIEDQSKVVTKAWPGKHWEEAVLKLKEIVNHHVKEEEGEIFRKAKKVISDKEALILKEKMHYLKGKFLIWLEGQTREKVDEVKKEKTTKARYTKKTSVRNHAKSVARPH